MNERKEYEKSIEVYLTKRRAEDEDIIYKAMVEAMARKGLHDQQRAVDAALNLQGYTNEE